MMMLRHKCITVLLCLSLSISLSTAFNHFVPWDKEIVYDYQALVKAGSLVPSSYASQFLLKGKLHLQVKNDEAYVKFSDLTYTLYNGQLDHYTEHHVKSIPLPTESLALLEPFKIVYKDGKVEGFFTTSEEKPFITNIKKAVATILQIDTNLVKNYNYPHMTKIKENSIYGTEEVLYNILRDGEMFEVTKMHDMKDTGHLYRHWVGSMEWNKCDEVDEGPLMHDSQKKYYIIKKDGYDIVSKIFSNGGFYYYPYKGHSETFYIFVNQTFELLKVMPIQTMFQLKSELFFNNLTYNMMLPSMDGAANDYFNGRRSGFSHLPYGNIITKLLTDILEYGEHSHMDDETVPLDKDQLINRLQKFMLLLDTKSLHDAWGILGQRTDGDKMMKLFYKMLPWVTTEASALLIRDLIVQKKVSDTVAIELLQKLSLGLKTPTHDTVVALEVFLNLPETLHWKIHSNALLAFGSILHKAYMLDKQSHYFEHFHGQKIELHDTMQSYPFDSFYDKYITDMVTKMKTTKDLKVQLTYLKALYNTKIEHVFKFMKFAVKGEWSNDFLFRSVAMWVAAGVTKNSDQLFELLWPILSNPHEPLIMRMRAYYFIVKTKPTFSQMSNIFWYMLKEPHPQLYNFHYTFMKTMATTKIPCKSHLRMMAKSMFPYMHPPIFGTSTFSSADFFDDFYSLGTSIHYLSMNTNKTHLFCIAMDSQMSKHLQSDMKYCVDIVGLDYNLKELFKMDQDTKFWNYDDITNFFKKILTNKDLALVTTYMQHDTVLESYYYDHDTVGEASEFFKFFFDNENTYQSEWWDIDYYKYHRVFMPTDIGMFLEQDFLMPIVFKFKFNMKKEYNNKLITFHMDNNFKIISHSRQGMLVYNSLVDVWQGVYKFNDFDFVSPTYFDLSINSQQQSMKLSVKKHGDDLLDVAGIKSYSNVVVILKDDFKADYLKQSCPFCIGFQQVTIKSNEVPKQMMGSVDSLMLGRQWDVMLYKCDHRSAQGSFNKFFHDIFGFDNKHFKSPFSYLMPAAMNLDTWLFLQPLKGHCGLLVKILPSTQYPVTNIDLTFRLNSDYKREGYIFTPGMKFNTRLTYAIKNNEQSLKTWDVNTILEATPGHEMVNLKMFLTKILPGQKDYKICVEGTQKWGLKTMTGFLNLAMGKSDDGKCAKDDTMIDVTFHGDHIDDQIEHQVVPTSCQYPVPYYKPHYHTLKCWLDYTSWRKYVYDIKMTNLPTEFKNNLLGWWDMFKGTYNDYYLATDEHNETIGDHQIRFEAVYPLTSLREYLNTYWYTKNKRYEVSGIPISAWWGIFPDNTLFPWWFQVMYSFGLMDQSFVYTNHWTFNTYSNHEMLKDDWVLYVGDAAQNPKHGVYVKKIGENLMGLKLVEKSKFITILPDGDTFKVTLGDSQILPLTTEMHIEQWPTMKYIREDKFNFFLISMPYLGVYLEYDKHHIHFVMPKSNMLFGKIFMF